MHFIHEVISQNIQLAWIVLIAAFYVLSKCANIFVDSAVALADRFNIPKIIIGIVLVAFATTAPELAVSLTAALRGKPEMALGNAIGSVICDDGLALGLCGLLSVAPIIIVPAILKTSGIFLIAVQVVLFLFVIFDHTLSRWEGVVLVLLFAGYLCYLLRQHKRGEFAGELHAEAGEKAAGKPLIALIGLFILALAGIIISSEFIVTSAIAIAHSFGVPDGVIALTLVALGTSIPEVATCVTAARKGEGAIAVGDIIGADILNICWVAGASAIANDLTLGAKEIYFMFPSMFIFVGAMLIMLWRGYRLTRAKGAVLLGLYLLYLASFFVFFPPN